MQAKAARNSGYRSFLDARGRLWEVWMVHPSSIERRKMERRSPVENAVFLIEQRVLGDRRAQPSSRAAVATEFSSGWLCFTSKGEKRRLAPVPVNWMSANDSQVAEWCRIAKRVVKCGPTWDPEDEIEIPAAKPQIPTAKPQTPAAKTRRSADPGNGRRA
jgi:hypothetical protein